MIRWFEQRQVYAPSGELAADPASLRRPFEEVSLKSPDGVRLHGWFFPAKPGAPRSHLALLLLHGNKGNITHRLHFYQAWLELGLNILTFDYRGYGQSEGTPGEEGTYTDAQTALAWLRNRGFSRQHLVVLGKSLGGGVGTELALREPVAGLILQSTFTSIPDIGEELFPWIPVRRWHRIHYDTIRKLPRIQTPVLIAHSRTDDLVGFHHAERNFEAARSPKVFLEIRGHHNNVIEHGRADYLAGLDKFLREHIDPQS
jgi:fermentation-respiration switch protein FrsA (DUF1100 family)